MSQEPLTETRSSLLRATAVPLLLPAAAAFVGLSCFQGAAPLVMKHDGAADSTVGLVVGCVGLGRVLTSIPAGSLSHRIGPQLTFCLAGLLMVVGVIVAAVWPGAVPGLLASATLVGAGAGALAVPRTELMQVLVPHAPSRRETGARLGGLFRVGYMVGPLLAALLLDVVNAHYAFASAAPFFVLCAVITAVSKEARAASAEAQAARATSAETQAAPQSSSIFAAVKKDFGLVVRVGGFCAAVFGLRTCRLFLTTLVALQAGWTASSIGLLLTVSYSVDTVFFWVGAKVTNRYGRAVTAVLLVGISAVGYGLLAIEGDWVTAADVRDREPSTSWEWATLSSSWYVAVGAICFGIADCFGSGLLIALVAECPRALVGPLQMIQDIGQLLGPVAAGALAHASSTRIACLAMVALAIGMVAWAVLLLPKATPATPAPTPSSGAVSDDYVQMASVRRSAVNADEGDISDDGVDGTALYSVAVEGSTALPSDDIRNRRRESNGEAPLIASLKDAPDESS